MLSLKIDDKTENEEVNQMNDEQREQWKRILTESWNDLQSARILTESRNDLLSACDTCTSDIELITSLSRRYNDICEKYLREVEQ
jgi:Mg2+ and Co2+ transporter CorA